MSIANHCPQCGSAIPADAPHGLCPKCVLGGAAPTEATGGQEEREAPGIEEIKAAFPQLDILELIGQGGMGFVYKARQKHLERFVALKVLCPKLGADHAFAERFSREARLLARLNHPNIVAVYDFGQSGGFFFLQMEFVDGVNLRQAMRSGKFTPAEALALVPKICDALQFAHDEGIMHRDIKPENILIDCKGRVKIADFGLAKIMGADRANHGITATGMTMGTPRYMAPEQLEDSKKVDHRADIYSLGVVFYEMLTGELPLGRFEPPSHKVHVDVRLDEVVLHTLEKEPSRRYQHVSEVKTDVEKIAATDPRAGGQSVPPAGATLAPGGTIVLGASGSQGEPPRTGAMPRSPAIAERRPLSTKAVIGAILVGFSLALGVPGALGISFVVPLAVSGHPGIGVGELSVIALLGVVVSAPGIAGMLLGISAWREVGPGPDKKRGAIAAVFAALGWPLAVLDLLLGVALGWVLFGLIMRLGSPLRLAPVATMPIAGAFTLAALGWVDWLILSWFWRRLEGAAPSRRRNRLVRAASLTLIIGLGAAGIALQFSQRTLSPTLRQTSHFALTPDPDYGPESANHKTALRWALDAAPRQIAGIKLLVISNNVEVMSSPLVASLRTSAQHIQGSLIVDVLNNQREQAEGPDWRVVLDSGSSGQASFEFHPTTPAPIRWTLISGKTPVRIPRQGSYDGAVLTGTEANPETGSARSHWVVRLRVDINPADLPLSNKTAELTQGQVFRLPFILTEGQAATFTLVRKDSEGEQEFPMLSAYALAPLGRSLSGEVRWIAAPNHTWTTVLDTEGGRATSGGLNTPGDWVPADPPAEPGFVLLPESTSLVKLAIEEGQPEQNAARLNVRVATQPHRLPAEVIKRGGGGTGTNWLRTSEELTRFMQ